MHYLFTFLTTWGTATDKQAISLTKKVLDTIEPVMEGLTSIGVGIGSILLLLVVFTSISQILGGSKFEVKMLVPALIYLAVCNFSLVAKPVVNFGITLQSGCISKMSDADYNFAKCWIEKKNKKDILAQSLPKEIVDPTNDYEGFEGEMVEEDSATPEETQKAETRRRKFSLSGIGQNVAQALENTWTKMKANFLQGFSLCKDVTTFVSAGASYILILLLQFCISAIQYMMCALGAVLVGIVVAFGPITWAFAILPGNGKVIQAWFIRICQFMLYGPIVNLIGCCLYYFVSNGSATYDLSLEPIQMIAVLIAGISCIFSVPAISQMIIDGASGGVSIMQGMSNISQGIQAIDAGKRIFHK